MEARHGVLARSLKFRAPDEVLGINKRVTDEACAADHADELFFWKGIPLLTRHLRVVDLELHQPAT